MEVIAMTIGTFTIFTLATSLVLLKLALMAFALILLAKVLFPVKRTQTPAIAHPRLLDKCTH
jgi:hypothetical protein